MSAPILVTAGGTGGHLFPAEALTAELTRRGHEVLFVTDRRGHGFKSDMPGVRVARIRAATIEGRNPLALLRAGATIALGLLEAWRLIGRARPAAAIGFGGYPALPAMLAARLRGLPRAIHEQNAVLGRANRFLAGAMTAVASSFRTLRFGEALSARMVMTGNPVRPGIVALAGVAYPDPAAGPFRIAVFGGSQGARIMSDVVPEALARLPGDLKARLAVVQQCRPEDLERTRGAYAAAGLTAELAAFFSDVPERLAAAHLVIARAGASTCAELSVMGRPAILVPYPFAMDDHQTWNAGALADAGAAVRVMQPAFTPEALAELVTALAQTPRRLQDMAAAARGLGHPRAAERLADLVEALATGRPLPRAHGPGEVRS